MSIIYKIEIGKTKITIDGKDIEIPNELIILMANDIRNSLDFKEKDIWAFRKLFHNSITKEEKHLSKDIITVNKFFKFHFTEGGKFIGIQYFQNDENKDIPEPVKYEGRTVPNDLIELLGFIDSTIAKGIHVYPLSNDQNQVNIFIACCKLEKLDKVFRKIDESDHIFFAPKEPQPLENEIVRTFR